MTQGYTSTNIAATTAAVTNRLVASANMKVGTYTLANGGVAVWQGGFLCTVTHSQVGGVTDTLGTVVFVGKDLFGLPLTETLTPVSASTVTGSKIFRSVTSVTGVGWVINTGNDTIVAGVAAGSYAGQGGGHLWSVTVNNAVATLITISHGGGTIAVIPASQAAGTEYIYDLPYSGYLKIATTDTNDVTAVHTLGVPSSYAMA